MDAISNLPFVSIIVLCYNHAQWVDESLNSITNQDYSNIEVVIIDDCSTDNSVELINGWINSNKIDCKFIVHEENKGICMSLNEALSHCTGKYIQLLSTDDILMPNKIKEQVVILEKSDDDVGLVFSDAYIIYEDSAIFGEKETYFKRVGFNKAILSEDYFIALLNQNFIMTSTALFKKCIYNKVGYYDENLVFEDWDMSLRMLRSYKFLFQDTLTVKYRKHNNSYTNNGFQDISSVRTILKLSLKHLGYTREADKLIKSRIVNSSSIFYINRSRDILKWMFLKFKFDMTKGNFILLCKSIIVKILLMLRLIRTQK